MDDVNYVILRGRVATAIEVRTFDNGVQVVRILVTVRTEAPRRRVDVIPVTMWDLDTDAIDRLTEFSVGDPIRIKGSIQRRFWDSGSEGRSRLEVVGDRAYKFNRSWMIVANSYQEKLPTT